MRRRLKFKMIDKLNIVVPDVDKGILDVIFCNFCALKTGR